ncbi:metallophosphoesterase family protein [bacterium]|nr:metallophosphoesterase family protein [candidate division CSSED10-310 bacterium]
MKYCIFSDVHGNLEALEAFFTDIKGIDDLLLVFLGDAIGYGPNPNECLELIRGRVDYFLMGNHDQAALDVADISNFNPYARNAILWTRRMLKDAHKDFLAGVEYEARHGRVTFVHATPCQPDRWHYIFTVYDAQLNFHCFSTQICFIGHSHQPITIIRDDHSQQLKVLVDTKVAIEPGKRYIINDGSVGQPRDGNPMGCYVLFDDDAGTLEFRRVAYDFKKTQRKMIEYGLPEYLIERLEFGR